MAQEIELKLAVKPHQLKQLRRSPLLTKHSCGAEKDQRLVSTYYDTDELALRDKQAILRVRKIGSEFVQTFKAQRPDPGSGLDRLEWERPLKRDRPAVEGASKSKTGGIDLEKLAGALKPVFETTVSRHMLPVRYKGSELEVALDQGEIKTGRRRQPIHEVEIELKHGNPGAVVALGRVIAGKLSASYGVASKAERGYDLREDALDAPRCAMPILLSKKMTAGEAFQAIAMSCLRHFAGNEGAVLAVKAEGVHQMRVGLRRLRAAISVFKEMLRGPETEAIKSWLKWLTEELGPARDMDVFNDEAIPQIAKSTPVPRAVAALKADVLEKRNKGFARAKRAVKSDRYRQLVLDTVFWINGGHWTSTDVALIAARREMCATKLARQELARRTDKVLKDLDKVEDLSPKKRHKLRIAIKKLRYAVGYFESLFGKKRKSVEALAEILKDVQSTLGKLNDIRVHGKLAKKYASPPKISRDAVAEAFAMGELEAGENAKSETLVKAAARQRKDLKACNPF